MQAQEIQTRPRCEVWLRGVSMTTKEGKSMVTFKQLLEEIGKVIVYKSAVTEYSIVLKDLTYDLFPESTEISHEVIEKLCEHLGEEDNRPEFHEREIQAPSQIRVTHNGGSYGSYISEALLVNLWATLLREEARDDLDSKP